MQLVCNHSTVEPFNHISVQPSNYSTVQPFSDWSQGETMADSMAQGAKEFGRGLFQGVTGVVMEVRSVLCYGVPVVCIVQYTVGSSSRQYSRQ